MSSWEERQRRASRPGKPRGGAQEPSGGGKRDNPEGRLQKAVVAVLGAWSDLYGDDRLRWVFHPPNGGKRTGGDRYLLVADGVRSGVSDLVYPFPGSITGFTAAFQELKSSTGRLSPSQAEFLKFAIGNGGACHVANTLLGALSFWRWYMGVPVSDQTIENQALMMSAGVPVGEVEPVELWQPRSKW